MEWDASDGMFGYLTRLVAWIDNAAAGTLDPDGAPLHPPVAYSSSPDSVLFVPRANVPLSQPSTWIGLAILAPISDARIDIVGWSELFEQLPNQTRCAPAILLEKDLPFEYPTKLQSLVELLEVGGVSLKQIYLAIQAALLQKEEGEPLYIVIGTPMRGVRTLQGLRYHLSVWKGDTWLANGLRIAMKRFSSDPNVRELGMEVETLVTEWIKDSDIAWCQVREDRPEVTERRDKNSSTSFFVERTVALWGCGALGSYAAEYLARAGVKKLFLFDEGIVSPGVLVRQNFEDLDVGQKKATALKERLHRIRPSLPVVDHNQNLITFLEKNNFSAEIDFILDTTASNAVLSKLEAIYQTSNLSAIPFSSIAVGHLATKGLAVTIPPGFSGGPLDVIRKAKLEACRRPELKTFLNEFWPVNRHPIFQPEPGCSDPTFIGSSADTASLAGLMLNSVGKFFLEEDNNLASANFIDIESETSWAKKQVTFHADIAISDIATGFNIRISHNAWHDLISWIRKGVRDSGKDFETGGLLFGERDDAANVFWIDEILGPPPDSISTEIEFECGSEGTKLANDEKKIRTRDSVQYLGMWHTHPGGSPRPSLKDLHSMSNLISSSGINPQSQAFLIIGGKEPIFSLCACVYRREELLNGELSAGACEREVQLLQITRPRDIGLALSGGGSRAIAFHLGCFRALKDKNLLHRVDVISSVSGGSVIGALYAYTDGDFDAFENRVVKLLKNGFAKSIFFQLLSPNYFVKILITLIISGISAFLSSILKFFCNRIGIKILKFWSRNDHSPFRRWFSRTTAFEMVLKKEIFGEICLNETTKSNVNVVINACELRTGTAFRFGNRESGSWRFYKKLSESPKIYEAVAASAASPVFLPALDKSLQFIDKSGNTVRDRVILTDGGIYDNLGTSVFDPDRNENYSTNVYRPDYIICCSAGAGQFTGETSPYWWPGRMNSSFEAVFRKNISHGYSQLHQWQSAGKIKAFVLPYLGQQDQNLPYAVAGLVPRDEVKDYPTDFNGMSDEDIERLAKRGEQLTRTLLSHHCPELC